MSLNIACAQLNQRVGDMSGNADRIIDAARRAAEQGAAVLLTPELSLTGCPPGDALRREAFQQQVGAALDRIRQASASLPALTWVVGYPALEDGHRYNVLGAFRAGQQVARHRKGVFAAAGACNDVRYFEPVVAATVLEIDGVRCALMTGAEVFDAQACVRARAAGAELVLCADAAPYFSGRDTQLIPRLRAAPCAAGMAVVYCNLVGGQDEFIFDGASQVFDASGEQVARAQSLAEDLLCVQCRRVPGGELQLSGTRARVPDRLTEIWQALVLAIRDYVTKNGFQGVVLGLSGGIDSALTLALAVDALGAERVRTLMMPSPYTADISLADAADMADRLHVKHEVLPIQPCFDAFRATLATTFAGLPEDLTEENIQARIRGSLLMAVSNKTGWLVLTTGNKSETAVGYSTLYGDLAGGFAPLKDVYKTLVYELARWRNDRAPEAPVIPERIITRAPSAELRPDQTDQDSLPPYEVLDRIIWGLMEQNRAADSLVAEGLPADAVAQVLRLMRVAEYKRQQAPVGPNITARAFGHDWQQPVTTAFRESVTGQG